MFSWHAYHPDPLAEPGAYLTVPSLERAGIRVAFTTRLGGVSAEPFATLNLSYASGDATERVRANRDRALAAIGMAAGDWAGGRQVHGTTVARVTAAERGRGADSAATTIPDTDALWTDEPGVAIAVLVADCVPVVLADPRARRVAVVHAGWRGLVGGIVEKAATVFEDPGRIVALAGPSIGPCCYEVGTDVAGPAAERFGGDVLRGKNLDLWTCVAAAVRGAGIRGVTTAGLCTRCERHRFYSHRGGDAARQGVVATIV